MSNFFNQINREMVNIERSHMLICGGCLLLDGVSSYVYTDVYWGRCQRIPQNVSHDDQTSRDESMVDFVVSLIVTLVWISLQKVSQVVIIVGGS